MRPQQQQADHHHNFMNMSRNNSDEVVAAAARFVKGCLWLSSWVVAVWWLVLWFLLPTSQGTTFKQEVAGHVYSSFFGKSATNYILYSCPVVALAILALLYLELEKKFPPKATNHKLKQSTVRKLWTRSVRGIWTQPLVVKGPLGVLTAIDFFGIFLILLVLLWVTTNYIVPGLDTINATEPQPGVKRWQLKVEKTAEMFGRTLPFMITLLFIPVTRGSPILRLIDVPFEHAVRYHRWLGQLTMILATAHAAIYCMYYGSKQQIYLMGEWKYSGVSNLAGVVAAVVALMMWATSMEPVRKQFFNVFLGVHQLYILLFAFYAWHVGKNHVAKAMGGIFLFFVDRFLRLVQSRRQLTSVSAQVLASGVVELKIPKHAGLDYSALSFLYINVPDISRLEWHPFSTTSSPLDGSDTISVCIKPLGDWTYSLHTAIFNAAAKTSDPEVACPFAVKLHVEGPYGHESNYYLRYKNLMLVAGGVGITPYLAIIKELLKRHHLKQDGLPTHVQLIWCVRRSSELSTLLDICPAKICPNLAAAGEEFKSLTIDVSVYVTGEDSSIISNIPKVLAFQEPSSAAQITCNAMPLRVEATCLAPTTSNQNMFILTVILASVSGFILMSGLFHVYIVTPHNSPEDPFSMALDVLMFFISMLVGIALCGGAVVLCWSPSWSSVGLSSSSSNIISTDISTVQDFRKSIDSILLEDIPQETLLDLSTIVQGTRPNFQGRGSRRSLSHQMTVCFRNPLTQDDFVRELVVLYTTPSMFEIFKATASKYEGEETGVLVCGPKGLQESVATECRAHNFGNWRTPFHFHSVSFDL